MTSLGLQFLQQLMAQAAIINNNACYELSEKLTRTAVHNTTHNSWLENEHPGVSDDVIICYSKFNSIIAWKLSHYAVFNFCKM